ncbi:squalene synthase HpnC [Nonomuraea sp. NPDC049486]|uniref:squalene synthase HpnC n=2 Tax=unclassified Nonomuraea TaxID=2593643 RepID=UPI003425FF58
MVSRGTGTYDFMSKAGQENFPVALRMLPVHYRNHLAAVYGFARFVDDLGDEGEPGDRLRLLDDVETDLDRLYGGSGPRLPVVRALTRTVESCAVPAEPFRRLLEANRRDQTVTRYDTFDDLLGYCELSANPVGHIVLHVFASADPPRLAWSDRVCSALQILEHCQDVGEDHARGRIYLPAQDLRRFGCAEADLSSRTTPGRLRRVVALQTVRAAEMLREGRPLVASLSGYARPAVAGYVAGGLATVAALDRAGHDVLGRAVRPRRGRLLAAWLRILTTWR